jgi:hypothetical protein
MTSDIKITIDEWYHIEISRKMKEGKMKINNGTLIKGRSEGRTRGLNIRSPIFFGGVNSKYYILSIAEDICYSGILVEILSETAKFQSEFHIFFSFQPRIFQNEHL